MINIRIKVSIIAIIISFVSFSWNVSLAKPEEPMEIKPYYETGTLCGATSGPIHIKLSERVSGEMDVTYFVTNGLEMLLFKIYPDTSLDAYLTPFWDDVERARQILRDIYPSSGGVFSPDFIAFDMKDTKLRVFLQNNDEWGQYGAQRDPVLFNQFQINIDDETDKPIKYMALLPFIMVNHSKDGRYSKFKDIEKNGLKEVRIRYGDIFNKEELIEYEIPINLSSDFIKQLKKSYKSYK